MFNLAKLLSIVFIAVFFTGCASSSNFFSSNTTEELVASHQYKKAITRLQSVTPNDLDSLSKVKKLASKHKIKQINKINSLVRQKQWGQARFILESLHTHQPEFSAYTSLKATIDNGEKEEHRLINTDKALLDVQVLQVQVNQQNLSKRINYNRVNWSSFFNNFDFKKQQLAKHLLGLSTQALMVKDYINAQKAYEKAIELDPSLGAGDITNAIKTGLSKQNNRAIKARKNSLIRQLNRAIKNKDYKALIVIQDILSNEIFNDASVKKALNKASLTLQIHAYRLDGSATTEYRKGNISNAIAQWQEALELMPEKISIQEKLIRAKKVQYNLEKIKRKKEI